MFTRTNSDCNNNNEVPANLSKPFRSRMKVNSDSTDIREEFIEAGEISPATARINHNLSSSSDDNSTSVYKLKSKMNILKKRPRRSTLFVTKEKEDDPVITTRESVLENPSKSNTVQILTKSLELCTSSSEESLKQALERNSGRAAHIVKLNTQQPFMAPQSPRLADVPIVLEPDGDEVATKNNKREFVPHPVSRGVNFIKMYVESYLVAKAKVAKLLPPSGGFKTFYHNFKDPVPVAHQYVVLPKSFYSAQSKEDDEKQKLAETIERTVEEQVEALDDAIKNLLLVLYFDNICASFMLKEKCEASCTKLHDLPLAFEVEKKLVKNSLEDAVNVHKLLQSFPSDVRKRYFPAIANVFAHKNSTQHLKSLINSTQAISPFPGFDFIITALIENGWNRCEAIHFVINNHTESESARVNLLEIVGTTGSDVVQFVNFLTKS